MLARAWCPCPGRGSRSGVREAGVAFGLIADEVVGDGEIGADVLESVVEGQMTAVVGSLAVDAHVPLAVHSGGVAGRGEELGDGELGVGESSGVSGEQNSRRLSLHPRPNGEATGEELRSTGSAESVGVELGEADALGGQLVEGSPWLGGMSVAGEVSVSQIVGEEDEDVGAPGAIDGRFSALLQQRDGSGQLTALHSGQPPSRARPNHKSVTL